MDENRKKIIGLDIWKYILLCFATIILFCSVKNYLVCLLYNTPSCDYLCPSFFGRNVFITPVFLQKVFDFQSSFLQTGQNTLGISGYGRNLLFSSLILAPLIEELMYRGPLFLLRKHLGVFVWWLLAFFLSVLFALSHGIYGVSLLPLVVLGLASSWLIMRTKSFWPCLTLHFLYNFHVVSYPFYQALFWGD